jgi:hypothetical protein
MIRCSDSRALECEQDFLALKVGLVGCPEDHDDGRAQTAHRAWKLDIPQVARPR